MRTIRTTPNPYRNIWFVPLLNTAGKFITADLNGKQIGIFDTLEDAISARDNHRPQPRQRYETPERRLQYETRRNQEAITVPIDDGWFSYDQYEYSYNHNDDEQI